MSEANRQDCSYCMSSPCKCTEEELFEQEYDACFPENEDER